MARARKKTVKPPAPVTGKGTLYVVATPIGNLEDITLRALRILKESDLIAAEDTRHTRKLLSHFKITTPTLSYYKGKERERAAVIIGKLHAGLNVALVSDAGTPCISDPGYILVQSAVAENIRIEPVPGPSSLTAALSVAGLTENTFVFLGFAPPRKKQRRDLLRSLCGEKRYLVFFEAPHRLRAFVNDALDVLGDRQLFWCRELTKMHEEQVHTTIAGLAAILAEKNIKGESVIIISGAPDMEEISGAALDELLKTHRDTGNMTCTDAVREIVAQHKLPRSAVYSRALKIWKG